MELPGTRLTNRSRSSKRPCIDAHREVAKGIAYAGARDRAPVFFARSIASCTRVRHLPQIAWHGACERRQTHSRAWHATCDFGPRVSMGPRNTQEKS